MMTGRHGIADETAALVNFGAAMVGLYHKKMTGEGQKIETSPLGGQIRLMSHTMTRVLMTGKGVPRGRARVTGGAVPAITACFNDKDGKAFAIQMIGEEMWNKLIWGMHLTGPTPICCGWSEHQIW